MGKAWVRVWVRPKVPVGYPMGGVLHLLRVHSVMLCVACCMGNQLWYRMMMVGVAGDDQVTCMGHRRHDTLGVRLRLSNLLTDAHLVMLTHQIQYY